MINYVETPFPWVKILLKQAYSEILFRSVSRGPPPPPPKKKTKQKKKHDAITAFLSAK